MGRSDDELAQDLLDEGVGARRRGAATQLDGRALHVALMAATAALVALRHLRVLRAFLLLLRPSDGHGARVVALHIGAALGVAGHVGCRTLQLLHGRGHRHRALHMARKLLERAVDALRLAGLVAGLGLVERGALLLESAHGPARAHLVAGVVVAAGLVAAAHLLAARDRRRRQHVVHHVVGHVLHQAPGLVQQQLLRILVQLAGVVVATLLVALHHLRQLVARCVLLCKRAAARMLVAGLVPAAGLVADHGITQPHQLLH
mmetsp:Transcript_732/g.1956  ORF Transcript_732/g.1956 Transcript_732/m.1956 type:complete len:261 (+) Transcript_732:304-1086(+)